MLRKRFFAFAPLLALLTLAPSQAKEWEKIPPEELASSQPSVAPEYGAEILLLRESIAQNWSTATGQFYSERSTYIRFKAYTLEGVNRILAQTIQSSRDERITNIAGRTLKPDGSYFELEKEHIFESESWKRGKHKGMETRFSFPQLAPGDIVELSFDREKKSANWIAQMSFRYDLPVRKAIGRLKPFEVAGFGHNVASFNFPDINLQDRQNGYYCFELENVAPSRDEPYSIPRLHLDPSILMYHYFSEQEPDQKAYWPNTARILYRDGRQELNFNKEMKDKVLELTQGISDPWAKVDQLHLYCQKRIQNRSYAYGVFTATELQELQPNRFATQTFREGNGWPDDINMLFGGLVRSLGYSAEYAKASDTRFILFNPMIKSSYSLNDNYIAVAIDDERRFYKPGSPFLPPGALHWWNQATGIIVGSKRGGDIERSPRQKADFSQLNREVTATLDEAGALKGSITLRPTGHYSFDMREELAALHGAEEREDWAFSDLKDRFPQASTSELSITEPSDSTGNVTVSFKFEIPGYAQSARDRLLLQPCVTEVGAKPVFVSTERESDVLFPFHNVVNDSIHIAYPEGYRVEEGSPPPPMTMGSAGSCSIQLDTSKTGQITARRVFNMTASLVPQSSYPALLQAYSIINLSDQFSITLRKDEP